MDDGDDLKYVCDSDDAINNRLQINDAKTKLEGLQVVESKKPCRSGWCQNVTDTKGN